MKEVVITVLLVCMLSSYHFIGSDKQFKDVTVDSEQSKVLTMDGEQLETLSKSSDPFFQEHVEEAVPLSDSKTFQIYYRVRDNNENSVAGESFWSLILELSLWNQTDKPIKNLNITAHFNEDLQAVFVNSTWYNEPVTLQAYSETDDSHGIGYVWEALLDLSAVGMLGGISETAFYDMLLEIKWDGGYELLLISEDDMKRTLTNPWVREDSKPVILLDETRMRMINEAGLEQRQAYSGE